MGGPEKGRLKNLEPSNYEKSRIDMMTANNHCCSDCSEGFSGAFDC